MKVPAGLTSKSIFISFCLGYETVEAYNGRERESEDVRFVANLKTRVLPGCLLKG